MYLAEIHGKLSSKVERMEDILTSNVFSFFKYSTREIFLKGYLNKMGFDISDKEARDAEFIFWPRYEEKTEPDLVIIAGKYYILLEAKYFSGFGEETKKTKGQLQREIEYGILEAKNYDKEFRLLAITADHYYKNYKFKAILPQYKTFFQWTNWQSISFYLNRVLESGINIGKQEREFCTDLYNLLDKKCLRDFQSFDFLIGNHYPLKKHSLIFFDAGTAGFRGGFIGFLASLQSGKTIHPLIKSNLFFEAKTADFRGSFIGFKTTLLSENKLTPIPEILFLKNQKKIFSSLLKMEKLRDCEYQIFYEEINDASK
jgi:hypothetical protein